jgi:hypothetical protein
MLFGHFHFAILAVGQNIYKRDTTSKLCSIFMSSWTAGGGWLWRNTKWYIESTDAALMVFLLIYLEVGICRHLEIKEYICPATNKGIGMCDGHPPRHVLCWLQQF